MFTNFKSNKRCGKNYLLKCFEETRKYSSDLEYEKKIFGAFLDKYKKSGGGYDFSTFGITSKGEMFDKIYECFLRSHCFGGIIKPRFTNVGFEQI